MNTSSTATQRQYSTSPMRPMANREDYNKALRSNLGSKLFFLEHVPVIAGAAQIVDFGCADAALLKALHRVAPQAEKVGVDNDPYQRRAALKNFPEVSDLVSSLFEVDVCQDGVSVLVLSSVLHEVLSADSIRLGGEATANFFQWWWGKVEALGFDYIVIRDFAVPAYAKTLAVPAQWVSELPPHERDLWAEVAAEWHDGEINLYSFIHYLLKRRWPENWEREIRENYLALDRETLLGQLQRTGTYTPIHAAATTTKHYRERTLKDLGFCPDVPTHLETVLVRSEWYQYEVKMAEAKRVLHAGTARLLVDGAGGAREVA